MSDIQYIDRRDRIVYDEIIYGGWCVRLLYLTRLGRWLVPKIARFPLVSRLYGWWQARGWTRRKIGPFVERFDLDTSEFKQPISAFTSFDAFFTRQLRPEARPLPPDPQSAVVPADGRYRFHEGINWEIPLLIKGNCFSLFALLGDRSLAENYLGGSLILGRLSVVDCHRFVTPVAGRIAPPIELPGALYSVNPLATRRTGAILTRNRRVVMRVESDRFGQVCLIAIGATCVGTIHTSYKPRTFVERGEEIGHFSFGGSALIALFEPGKLDLAPDLSDLSQQSLEVLCHYGQALGAKCR